MSTPELLKDLLVTVQCLKKEPAGSDAGREKEAQEAYRALLDQFYEEYPEMLAPQQYRAARDDPDYFLMLINLSRFHEEEQRADKKGEQSHPYFNWKLFTQI